LLAALRENSDALEPSPPVDVIKSAPPVDVMIVEREEAKPKQIEIRVL